MSLQDAKSLWDLQRNGDLTVWCQLGLEVGAWGAGQEGRISEAEEDEG